MRLNDNITYGGMQKVNSDSDELGDQRLTSFHEKVAVIQKIAGIIKPYIHTCNQHPSSCCNFSIEHYRALAQRYYAVR